MIQAFGESIIAYISTNIDDVFILMLLFAQCTLHSDFIKILIGRYLGIGAVVILSLLAAFGLGFFPQEILRLLGIVPILLGIKTYYDSKKESGSEDTLPKAHSSAITSAALITMANSADNIGVYIPLFAGYTLGQMLIMIAVFAAMTLLWCLLGRRLANLPLIAKVIEKYKRIAIPMLYILLGIYILIF